MIGPLEAFIRHPILTLLPILLAAGIGLFIGLDREPVYTAKARITVGRTDVPAYVLQNVIGGNQALAAGYARVIATVPVVESTAEDSGASPEFVRDHLDATPVPGSTLIQVEATGPGSDEAVVLANDGAKALIDYVQKVTRDSASKDALKRYREAQAEVVRRQRRFAALQRQGRRREDDLARARVSLDAARLRASNLANLYRAANSDPTAGSPLQLIAPAAAASSDRREVLERVLLIGLAAGLVVGFGIALLRANYRRLRALRG